MILLTTMRGNPLIFWLLEIVVLVAVWRAVTTLLRSHAARVMGGNRNPLALGVATAVSAVVFLALWCFAVAFSGGKVDLVVVLAYVLASAVFLFLVSTRNRLTNADDGIRMPLVTVGAVAMIAVGLLYLGGGTL